MSRFPSLIYQTPRQTNTIPYRRISTSPYDSGYYDRVYLFNGALRQQDLTLRTPNTMITIAGEDSGDVEGMSSDTTTDGYTSTVTIEVLNYPIPSGSLCDCVYFPDEFTLKACDDQAEWGSFQVILSGVISYLGEPVYEEKVCYEVDFVDVAGVYGTCADTFGRVITDDYDLCVVSNTAEESSSSIESATVSSTTSSIETESSSDTAFRGSSSSSTPASNSLDSTAPATTAPPVESESSFAKPTRSSVSGLLTFVLLAALALQ